MFTWKTAGFSFSLKHNQFIKSSLQFVLVFAVLISLVGSAIDVSPAHAATTLSVTPITWNVIGLDSNNVNVGPNRFPIGARVCNTGASAATNVTATFVWDETPAPNYINIRPGTNSVLTTSSIPSTDPDTCVDFYYEVEVDRNASAYNFTREYHIEVTETGTPETTWSTPTPRELFVEHLISQSRNSTETVRVNTDGTTWDGTTEVAPGGTMNLMVGGTYYIRLEGFTATNGYEQLETFINLPNVIFQVLSATSTYTAFGGVGSPYDRLYADGCTWENNPMSPNYRSCLSTGKDGGDITVTYQVKILSMPSSPLTNPEALLSLIYDFSGSSYHYNADFSASTRYAKIVQPVQPTLKKSFAPKSINPGGVSDITFTITNPGPIAISSVNFTDNPLSSPAGVVVDTPINTGAVNLTFNAGAKTITRDTGSFVTDRFFVGEKISTSSATNPGPFTVTNVAATVLTVSESVTSEGPTSYTVYKYSRSGCGSPTYTPVAGASSVSFSGGTVAALSTCTLTVTVTAASANTYVDTTQNLFVGSDDTGSYGTDTLVVTSEPAPPSICGTRIPMATWDFSNYTASTSANNGPFTYSSKHADVSTASATYGAGTNTVSGIGDNTTYPTGWSAAPDSGGISGVVWGIGNNWPVNGVVPTDSTTPYFQFQADASNFGGLQITSSYNMNSNWSNADKWYVLSSTDGTTWSSVTSAAWNKSNDWKTGASGVSAITTITGASTIYFRIIFTGAQYTGNPSASDAIVYLDDVSITGCPRPTKPTLSKAFSTSPIQTGTSSTLTFTFTNPNAVGVSLNGVAFSDVLPLGLEIADPNGLTSVSCTDGAISGQSITATAGTRTISMSGATITRTGGTNTSCSFSVNVKGAVAGAYTNTSGSITSTETGPNTTSSGYGIANLTVVDPPVITKTFGKEFIYTGDNPGTSMTFTLSNPNISTQLTGVGFTAADSLPSGLVVATPNGLNATCDDAPYSGTITATAGSSSVNLTGVTLAAGASCALTVNVTGTSIGQKDNSVTVGASGPLSLTGNTATAKILVRDRTPALSLMKQVSANGTDWYDSIIIASGSNVYYKFTVENTGDRDLTSLGVTDPDVDTSSCSWPATLYVADADEGHLATCIVGPVTAIAGGKKNTAQAQGTYSSTVYNSNYDSATYLNGNFGHLPNAPGDSAPASATNYPNTNLFNNGGAFHLNGTTYLGASVTTTATDGPATPYTYADKSTDNGVEWGPIWDSGTGSAYVTATCDPAGSRVVYAWFDWNGDGDFNDNDGADGDESYNWTVGCSPAGTETEVTGIDFPGGGVLASDQYFVRFRIYDTAPSNPQPYGIARESDGDPIVGEIEDYSLYSDGGGGAPTPVTLSYFKAESSGGSVNFAWSTATESGNLGFNLYAEEGGQLVKLNPEIIPSQKVDSLERLDYSYRAATNATVFFLDEIDVQGRADRHGPFFLGEAYGSREEDSKVDWSAIGKERNQADAARQAALRPGLAALPDNPTALTLKVTQSGLYRVTYEQLKAAGLELRGVALTKVALTNQGKAIPIYVKGARAFGSGAYIEFYGEALDTLYTNANIYTLQITQSAAPRIPVRNQVPNRRIQPPASYIHTLTVNNQKAFANYAPGKDPWYDKEMLVFTAPKTWDYTFQVEGLVASSAATVELSVWGITNWPQGNDHHMQVSVNGIPLADEVFDGLVEKVLVLELPAGLLREGTNTLTVALPGDTGVEAELITFDQFSVKYARVMAAKDGRLTFTASDKVFKVTNLPTRNAVVYRQDAGGIVKLGQVEIKASGGTYTATFAGTGQPASYFVSAVESLLSPQFEAAQQVVDLNRPAEYLVIAHPNFIPGLEPLVAARRAQGLTVSVVNVNDLYIQYSYGIFDPSAIQKYIAYAAGNLGTKYVLLVGGDTYDYRNYLGINSISFVPSLYTKTGPIAHFIPSDPLYADVNGDKVPDLAIGRFPVRTTAELDMMVSKTLAYDAKTYGKTAVFASDKRDGSISFKAISNELVAKLPSGWTVESVHLDDMTVTAARGQLLAAMNRGTALVTFTGHSEPREWTFSGLFKLKDAQALTNAGRPFVVVQWGCWNTYYVDPLNNYLVQGFLVSGDRGAAAALGATTLADSRSENLLGRLLMPRMTAPGIRLGDALQASKAELAQAHPEMLDVILGWSLMGDPALVVQP